MTIEEAKDYIREWCPYDRQEEIIKALEQEPCEDAISQKIDEFKLKGKTAEIWIVKGKLQIRYLGIIHNIPLPSVTPKQKIGRWIDDKCSVCGKGIEDLISSPEWYRNEEPNFCPYCGVKLGGKSE